ncbi:MAG: LptF/LptG family permease [Fimbriimonas sp.]
MKKLDSYVLKEMMVPFLIGTLAVVLMFQANTYIAVAKRLNMENVPLKAVLQFILFSTPTYLNLTLPVGAALGSSLAMSRLARESELTAMRAAGARILRVIAPIAWFGLGVALMHFYMVERIMPRATTEANRIGMQIGYLGYAPDVKTNAMLNLGKFTASFGSVFKRGEELEIQKILLIEQPEPDVTQLITADKARYTEGKWQFENAYFRILHGQDLTTAKPIGTLVINERIIPGDIFNPPVSEELSASQLWESIKAGRRLGNDTKRQEVAFHTKFALPVACFIFAFVAPIFAIVFARGGGFVGVLLSFGLCILYYNAFIISTEILYKFPFVPAWLAAWITNILFALLGLIAIRRLE